MKRLSITLAIATLAVYLPSCSIKEDRDDCPCILSVQVDSKQGEGSEPSALDLRIDSGWERHVPSGEYGSSYEVAVPRGISNVSALSGSEGMSASGTVLAYAGEGSYPALFARSETVDCRGETASDTVRLYKQFANIAIMLDNPSRPMTLKSGWNGLDIKTLEPVKGAFAATPAPFGDDCVITRVPRQGDSSLRLEFLDGDGLTADSVDLGEVLERAGYDWGKRSLDDIIVTLESAAPSIAVEIIDWADGERIEIIV